MSSFPCNSGIAMPQEDEGFMMSKEEIQDELTLQRTLLESLDPSSDDFQELKTIIEGAIGRLRSRLASLKQKKQQQPNVVLKGPFLAAALSSNNKTPRAPSINSSQTFGAPVPIATSYHLPSSQQPSHNNYNSPDPFADPFVNQYTPANMDPFPGLAGGPPQTNITILPHRNVTSNMKRSIDESLGLDIKEESGNKSRRTSPGSSIPTPTAHKPDSSGFIDLCDSDEEDARQKQINALERAEMVQKDREQAQKMQHRYNGLSTNHANTPPVPLDGSAHDRLMGRTSGSSQAPQAFKEGSGQGFNVSNGVNSGFHLPGAFPIDLSDDEVQFTSSRPIASPIRRPNAPASGSYGSPYSSALGPTWQNTGVAASQRPTHFSPYSPYLTQAVSSNQVTQPPYSMDNLAQTNGLGMGAYSSSSLLSGTGFSGSSWQDPIDMAVRNNLSQGQQHDLETYITDPRRTKEDIQNLLSNLTPDINIPKGDRSGTPEGMRFPLYAHQQVALTWLKNMETGTNKGGILADDMGLGKTISTIALILSRPSNDLRCKTTLIVAPVALLKQWEKEIKDKINPGYRLSVFVNHGSHKAKRFSDLQTYDVVLTSYGTLASEYKKRENLQSLKMADKDMDLTQDKYQKQLPFLGDNSKWYRVVLDEAQNIKNQGTKSAKAVSLLQSNYRFCLTGTPMMNGVHELYSLIRFLRIRPYCESTQFQEAFGVLKKGTGSEKALQRAMKRLQVLLRSIILRRTKTSTIDGEPIITLPPKTEEVIHAIFDEDQQKYYTALESSSKVEFNKYLKAGTVGKNYSNVLVLLLRLRQAACHPHLIMDLEQAAVSGGADMIALAKTLPGDVVSRLMASELPFECPVCYELALAPVFTLNCCHHVCSECLAKITSNVNAADEDENGRMAKPRCPTCRGDVDINNCIDWGSFKAAHMPDEATAAVDDDSSDYSDSDSDSDVDDREKDDVDAQGNLKGFIVDDDEVDDGFVSRKLGSKQKTQVKPGGRSSRQIIDDSETEDDTDDRDVKPVKSELKAEAEDPEDDYCPELPDVKKPKVELKDDDFLPENPVEARARGMFPENLAHVIQKVTKEADDKAARKQARKEKRDARAKSGKKGRKDDEKAPHKHLNLAILKKEASKNAEGRRKYMRYLRKNWVSSAKIDKLMDLLRDTPKDVKTIVFSQFTTLLDLCEIPIVKEGIGLQRYDGGMRADQRNIAVEKFQNDKTTRVLLVSLKAGNAGLNLVAGSQVVIMDPFWNPYVEMQAVDRAYRIGQQNPVTVHRIVIKGTVEDRILALQERKRKVVDSALDEQSGNAVSKLGIQELTDLFNGEGDPRETLIRPPPALGVPNYGAGGGLYASSGLGTAATSEDNAGLNAFGPGSGGGLYGSSGLGSVAKTGLNAGLNAYSSGAGLGSAIGSAARTFANAVVDPRPSGMTGMGGGNVYRGTEGGGANGPTGGNSSGGGTETHGANLRTP